tara:strand:- start:693 stop:905 length:213 start_codon:yes stop_codon:yes gene_type:complete
MSNWTNIEIITDDMKNAMNCDTCMGYKIEREPNKMEIFSAESLGVSWKYQNDGTWVWKNPNYRGYPIYFN